MALELKVYDDGDIFLSTDNKAEVYTAIRFLVKEVEKLEIRGRLAVTILDIPEKPK